MKRQTTDHKKTFTNFMSVKGLISRLYKELLQEDTEPSLKMGKDQPWYESPCVAILWSSSPLSPSTFSPTCVWTEAPELSFQV